MYMFSMVVGCAQAAELKVAVVNVQKVLSTSQQVKDLQEKLKQQFGPKEDKMRDLQKSLQADLEKYNRDSAIMKDNDKQALQQKIMKQQDELRDLQSKFQQELIAAQNEGMQGIIKQIDDVVKKEAAAKHYSLVLTNASVIFNDKPVIDITDVVIKNLK